MKTFSKINKLLISIVTILILIINALPASASKITVKTSNPPSEDNKFYFDYQSNKKLEGAFMIRNVDPINTQHLHLYATDGMAATGAVSFSLPEQEQTQLGSWIELDQNNLTLPPKDSQEIHFKINAPENIIPGTYIGGIAIEDYIPEDQKKQKVAESSSNMSVAIISRRMTIIYLNVPGEIIDKYSLSNIYISQDRNQNFVNFDLKNEGNSILNADGNFIIKSKQENTEKTNKIDNILISPGKTYAGKFPININKKLFDQFDFNLDLKINTQNIFTKTSKSLSSETRNLRFHYINWAIIRSAGIFIFIILLVIFFKKAYSKHYLKSCEPYTCAEKESLTSIATKFQMNWKKLAQINNLTAPYELTAGQIILVKKSRKNADEKNQS